MRKMQDRETCLSTACLPVTPHSNTGSAAVVDASNYMVELIELFEIYLC